MKKNVITIPRCYTSIDKDAFKGKQNFTSVKFLGKNKSKLKNIGEGAFQNTKLESLIIPNNVTSIENNAFADNTNLTKITIKKGLNLQIVGSSAFPEGVDVMLQNEAVDNVWSKDKNGIWTRYPPLKTTTAPQQLHQHQCPTDGKLTKEIVNKLINNNVLTIPNCYTSIGEDAFEDNTNFKLVIFERGGILSRPVLEDYIVRAGGLLPRIRYM